MTKSHTILKRLAIVTLGFVLLAALLFTIKILFFAPEWEITDDLEGNVFPSVILSTATSDRNTIKKNEDNMLGNPKSPIGIKIKCTQPGEHIQIRIEENEFLHLSKSQFTLPELGKTYVIYPDMIWKYAALRANRGVTPTDLSITVKTGLFQSSSHSKTLAVRSINECLLGYRDKQGKYHSTKFFYAAYVNEEHPMIDTILREALQTGIVKQFVGYQHGGSDMVRKQVFAVWYALQKRGFRYSSLTNTSLSSEKVFTQRIRLIGDSWEARQLNCADGCSMMASVLKGMGIDPILVRIPGHIFLGFYLDKKHAKTAFLETTLIGTLDAKAYAKQHGEASAKSRSLAKFNQALNIGSTRYNKAKAHFKNTKNPNYMLLEINDNVRALIQPINK